jgi:hypothetical protein
MAEASEPPLVKLICGMISARKELFGVTIEHLAERFGPVDLTSEIMDFDFTRYYDEEMGSPLYRQFVAFERLVSPDALVDAKCFTNELERELADKAAGELQRAINLDPGYVESSKLVLGSMKNFAHRVYLGRGVYADLTLLAHKNKWEPLGWTFPDYASPRYHSFLTEVRNRLLEQNMQESPS